MENNYSFKMRFFKTRFTVPSCCIKMFNWSSLKFNFTCSCEKREIRWKLMNFTHTVNSWYSAMTFQNQMWNSFLFFSSSCILFNQDSSYKVTWNFPKVQTFFWFSFLLLCLGREIYYLLEEMVWLVQLFWINW